MSDKLKGQRFTTPVGRLSFPKLTKPEAYKGNGQKHYQANLAITKGTDVKAIKRHCLLTVAEKFGKNKDKWPSVKMPWDDGDAQQRYESLHGCWVFKAKTKEEFRPTIYDANREDITDTVTDKDIYGGRYARLGVASKLTTTNNKDWYVSLYLQAVQLITLSESKAELLELEKGKGEPFGGSNRDMFDDDFAGDTDSDLTDSDEDTDIDFDDSVDDDDIDDL